MSVVNFGSYNPHKRRQEMQDRLAKELQIVEQKILKKFNTEEDETSMTSQQNFGDALKVEMQGYTREVEDYRIETELFKGPHFTRPLKALLSKGWRIHSNLDKITGAKLIDADIREEKKKLINDVEQILQDLKSKVHEDHCDDCEVTSI